MPDPLATTDDLDARGITLRAGLDADTLLNSASDAVRDAAGCSISYGTSTVKLIARDREIELPAGPVADVASIYVGTTQITGWTRLGSTITLPWQTVRCPVEITVTYSHGYPVVPADIVDLVCGMVAVAANDGYDGTGNASSSSVRLGDFGQSETRAAGSESPSPMALPDRVRDRLRARFSGSAAVIGAGR